MTTTVKTPKVGDKFILARKTEIWAVDKGVFECYWDDLGGMDKLISLCFEVRDVDLARRRVRFSDGDNIWTVLYDCCDFIEETIIYDGAVYDGVTDVFLGESKLINSW